MVSFDRNMFRTTDSIECRRRGCRGWVGAVLAALLLTGCGGPEANATDSSRSLVESFKEGEHVEVCEALTSDGGASLVSEAASKERGGQVSDCESASQFLLDGTTEVGRNSLDVEGEPTDVDVGADGARVQWEDCCSFELEELDGDYRVSGAGDLGLYFEAAGAGAGAGGGSPAAPDAQELEDEIRDNLEQADQDLPGIGFARRVAEIEVEGTEVTLIATTGSRDTITVGICRGASGGVEDDALENLPGVSALLIETDEGETQDCDDLIEPV